MFLATNALATFIVMFFAVSRVFPGNDESSGGNVKLFASRQTMESLRVTLMSVLSLTDFAGPGCELRPYCKPQPGPT